MHVLTVDISKWPHLEPAACILISLHDQKKMQKNEIWKRTLRNFYDQHVLVEIKLEVTVFDMFFKLFPRSLFSKHVCSQLQKTKSGNQKGWTMIQQTSASYFFWIEEWSHRSCVHGGKTWQLDCNFLIFLAALNRKSLLVTSLPRQTELAQEVYNM